MNETVPNTPAASPEKDLQANLNKLAGQRKMIPLAFAVAVVLFFFSFCNFKCSGTTMASLKGINLVTGTHLKTQADEMLPLSPFANDKKSAKGQEVPSDKWAVIAFLAGIAGVFVFYKKLKKESLIGTILGAIGFVSLFLLRIGVIKAVEGQGGEMGAIVEVDFTFAYWLCLLCFLAAGGISYLRLGKEKEAGGRSIDPVIPEKQVIPITGNKGQENADAGE